MASTYVVGISGGSGSGKTSFLRALREQFEGQMTTFSQDDYYYPLDKIPLDKGGIHNFDLPASIDSASMATDIEQVLDGKSLTRQEYTFETSYREDDGERKAEREGKQLTYKPMPLLVVEGLFAFHEPALRRLMDLSLFVDVSDVAKMSRRIRRDRVERGLPLEDVLFRYEAHVLPAYKKYVEPHRSDADLIINNLDNFDRGLRVVRDHLAAVLAHG